jgi:hypothetical protein
VRGLEDGIERVLSLEELDEGAGYEQIPLFRNDDEESK